MSEKIDAKPEQKPDDIQPKEGEPEEIKTLELDPPPEPISTLDDLMADYKKAEAGEVPEEEIKPEEIKPLETPPQTPEQPPAQPPTQPEPKPTEPELPDVLNYINKEKYGEPNLDDQLEVDALNFWEGGPKPEWTLKNIGQMTEREQTAFKKYQQGHETKRIELEKQSQAQPQTQQYSQAQIEEASRDISKLLQGDEETIQKYNPNFNKIEQKAGTEPQKPKVNFDTSLKEVGEAFENQDKEAFTAGLSKIISDVVERTENRVKEETQTTRQGFQEDMDNRQEKQHLADVEIDARKLANSDGAAFMQYIDDGSLGDIIDSKNIEDAYEVCMLHGYADHLSDGALEKIVSANSTARAYDLCKRYSGSKTPVYTKPSSVEAVSPPGSGAGVEPALTDKDLDGGFVELAEKAAKQVGFQ